MLPCDILSVVGTFIPTEMVRTNDEVITSNCIEIVETSR